LNEVRVINHESDQFIVGELALCESEVPIDLFAFAQEIARSDPKLVD